jgi:hypothetical protein
MIFKIIKQLPYSNIKIGTFSNLLDGYDGGPIYEFNDGNITITETLDFILKHFTHFQRMYEEECIEELIYPKNWIEAKEKFPDVFNTHNGQIEYELLDYQLWYGILGVKYNFISNKIYVIHNFMYDKVFNSYFDIEFCKERFNIITQNMKPYSNTNLN